MTGSLLDPNTLQQLLQRLASSDIDELEVECGSARLYLRRDPAASPAALHQEPGPETSVSAGLPVAAPLTGIYYSRPDPNQAPFVSVGDLVEQGQVVALIETMKLFNEVITDVAGVVVAIRVEDGDLVEVGQWLMEIKPSEEKERE